MFLYSTDTYENIIEKHQDELLEVAPKNLVYERLEDCQSIG